MQFVDLDAGQKPCR